MLHIVEYASADNFNKMRKAILSFFLATVHLLGNGTPQKLSFLLVFMLIGINSITVNPGQIGEASTLKLGKSFRGAGRYGQFGIALCMNWDKLRSGASVSRA